MNASVAPLKPKLSPRGDGGRRSRTILVTGGAGFIGSNFVRLLYDRYPNYRVLVVDALTYAGNLDNLEGIEQSDRFSFHYGDIRNRDLLDRLVAQSDIVVHFAAESHVSRSIADSASVVSTEVVGTDVVASCIARHKRTVERFIHISTSEVYGTAVRQPMDEEHPLNPASPYAGAKAGADRLVYSYCYTYDLPVVIVRPFNNYGPRQHLEKLVPRLITSSLLDEKLPIHGDGSAARDWVFVEDHCEALDLIMHAPLEKVKGEVFNVGTGNPLSVLEIAKMVVQKTGKDERAFHHIYDRPGQVDLHVASIEKIRRVLGFAPTTSFSDGLDRTIAWYAANESIWRRQLWLRHIEIETPDGKIVH
jgi:dTDP-glucose 4,6-dehydratase